MLLDVTENAWRNTFASIRLMGLAVLASVAAGCVIPRPYSALEITRIENEEIEFIEAGTTKREQILASLGLPDEDFGEGARWLYVLKSHIDGGVQWCGGDLHACTDRKNDRTDTYLDIAFEDSGIVKDVRTIMVKNRDIPDGVSQGSEIDGSGAD